MHGADLWLAVWSPDQHTLKCMLQFKYKMSPQAHVLKGWGPVSGAISGGDGDLRFGA
jgi:hypothetical protein